MGEPSTTSTSALSLSAIALAALFTGLSAGFFVTYEYSVTRALHEVSDEIYVTTFQAINATIRSPEFGAIFFGSMVLILIAIALNRKNTVVRNTLLAAALAYFVTVAITATVHVPLNNTLALVDALNASSGARHDFEQPWNTMHSVRTICVVLAFILTIVSMAIGQFRNV